MLKIPDQLISNRIILRPYRMDDLEPLYGLMRDERVTKFLNFNEEQKTYEGTKSLLESIIHSYATEKPIFALAIEERSSFLFLGSCGLSLKEEPHVAECFYALCYEYWKNGYAVEAIRTLFHYAFKSMHLQKIIVYVHPHNTNSWRLAERSGMRYMGHKYHDERNQKLMFLKFTQEDFQKQFY